MDQQVRAVKWLQDTWEDREGEEDEEADGEGQSEDVKELQSLHGGMMKLIVVGESCLYANMSAVIAAGPCIGSE